MVPARGPAGGWSTRSGPRTPPRSALHRPAIGLGRPAIGLRRRKIGRRRAGLAGRGLTTLVRPGCSGRAFVPDQLVKLALTGLHLGLGRALRDDEFIACGIV